MIICLCEAVNERRIRQEIRHGADSIQRIRRACGAGGGCGQCVCDLKTMLREENTPETPVRMVQKVQAG